MKEMRWLRAQMQPVGGAASGAIRWAGRVRTSCRCRPPLLTSPRCHRCPAPRVAPSPCSCWSVGEPRVSQPLRYQQMLISLEHCGSWKKQKLISTVPHKERLKVTREWSSWRSCADFCSYPIRQPELTRFCFQPIRKNETVGNFLSL